MRLYSSDVSENKLVSNKMHCSCCKITGMAAPITKDLHTKFMICFGSYIMVHVTFNFFIYKKHTWFLLYTLLLNIYLMEHVKIIKGMFTQWQHSKNNHRWQRYIVLVSVRQKLTAYSHQEAWQILSTVSIPNIMYDEICSCGRLCTWQFSSTVGILLIHVCGGKENIRPL